MCNSYDRKQSLFNAALTPQTDEEEKTQQKDKVRLQKIEQDTKKRKKEVQDESTRQILKREQDINISFSL